jgi:hypothetical protein
VRGATLGYWRAEDGPMGSNMVLYRFRVILYFTGDLLYLGYLSLWVIAWVVARIVSLDVFYVLWVVFSILGVFSLLCLG